MTQVLTPAQDYERLERALLDLEETGLQTPLEMKLDRKRWSPHLAQELIQKFRDSILEFFDEEEFGNFAREVAIWHAPGSAKTMRDGFWQGTLNDRMLVALDLDVFLMMRGFIDPHDLYGKLYETFPIEPGLPLD